MGMKMQYSSRTLSLLQENLRQADDKDGTLARSFKCRVNLTFTVFKLADCESQSVTHCRNFEHFTATLSSCHDQR